MELVRQYIATLSRSISTLLTENESIKHGEYTESKKQKIKDELTKNEEILKKMDKLCELDELSGREKLQLEEEIRNLRGKVAELEEDLRRKDEEMKKLNIEVERHETKFKEMENALQTGQIAYQFEKDLAKYIYPHDKKFSSRKIFTNMKNWLEDKKDTQQGREANKRWKKLQDEFAWSSEHEEVFFKPLEFRRPFAHPALDQNVAQFLIPDSFTDKEQKCIEVINKMIERVSELLQE